MSLTNPVKKMSKSDTNDKSRILITDDSATIKKKINRAITDSEDSITFDPERRPGLSNLLQILHYAEGRTDTPEQFAQELNGTSKKVIKEGLSDAVDGLLKPVRERYADIVDNDTYLDDVAQEGAVKAMRNAEDTMVLVREAIGF
jgi:tryptophanyl-tRNA synthetase